MNLDDQKIIDISPVLNSEIAVFPGDCAFKRTVHMDFDQGHHLGLSSIETTVHVGAHTDAPNHYHKDGASIENRDLCLYMGSCQVVEVEIPAGKRIGSKDIKDQIKCKRVLFKTNSFPEPNKWNNDFNALEPALIEELGKQGVVLIGIDTPSVDLSEDKELVSHAAIYKYDMAILEGIVLKDVAPGEYQLVALPLPIKGADASPVRAVLIQ
jgi:arylformamidase